MAFSFGGRFDRVMGTQQMEGLFRSTFWKVTKGLFFGVEFRWKVRSGGDGFGYMVEDGQIVDLYSVGFIFIWDPIQIQSKIFLGGDLWI